MKKYVWLAAFALIFLVALIVMRGREKKGGESPEIQRSSTGIASYYGPGFAGKETASGEIMNPRKLTAAHRTLPMGTMVRVTNLENGLSVVVEITDRGPYAKGRDIDLSVAAARKIRMKKDGVTRVRMQILGS